MTGIVTDTNSATDTYTATDKVVDTVTDIETDIEKDTNSFEGMFTGIAKHSNGNRHGHKLSGVRGWGFKTPWSRDQLPLEKCQNMAGVGFDQLAA